MNKGKKISTHQTEMSLCSWLQSWSTQALVSGEREPGISVSVVSMSSGPRPSASGPGSAVTGSCENGNGGSPNVAFKASKNGPYLRLRQRTTLKKQAGCDPKPRLTAPTTEGERVHCHVGCVHPFRHISRSISWPAEVRKQRQCSKEAPILACQEI